MVIHAMDTENQFPYKQIHMLKVKNAFRQLLLSRTGINASTLTDQPR
ncbi:hypothetical protein GALL_524360 [mine drainage metagenome]|uniref:Uncharacterized protein n=1 Tax=mine drainage metagenome TaxID=410659 RepID=A0A1J5P373_9ZZZZ